jgi:hypothetical protein
MMEVYSREKQESRENENNPVSYKLVHKVPTYFRGNLEIHFL